MEVYVLKIFGRNKGRGFGGWVKGIGTRAVLFGKREKGGSVPTELAVASGVCLLILSLLISRFKASSYLRLEWSQGRSGGQ